VLTNFAETESAQAACLVQ